MNTPKTTTTLTQALAHRQTSRTHTNRSYFPAYFIYCALPQTPTDNTIWHKKNGAWEMTITPGVIKDPTGPIEALMPSGKLARAALMYLTTEAKKTGSNRIDLATSYRGFLKDIGIPNNQRNATEALRQLRAVLAMNVQFFQTTTDPTGATIIQEVSFKIGSGLEIHFDSKADLDAKDSYLLLSTDFTEQVLNGHAAPIVTDAWKELISRTKSSLALDAFMWLSNRLPTLEAPLHISWEQIAAQFGTQSKRLDHFKTTFRKALVEIKEVYPEANITELGTGAGARKGFKGLLLHKSTPPTLPQLNSKPE